MLARVNRLEATRAPALSPIALAFGSCDGFAAWADEEMAAGVRPIEFPIVLLCLRLEKEMALGACSGAMQALGGWTVNTRSPCGMAVGAAGGKADRRRP